MHQVHQVHQAHQAHQVRQLYLKKLLQELKKNESEFLSRQSVLELLRRKNKISFNKISIYCRPVNSGNTPNEGDAVLLGAGGFFHTMIILQGDTYDIFLDRVVEGIRTRFIFHDIESDTELNKEFTTIHMSVDIKYTADELVKFIEKEEKYGYSLLTNNCIHFAWNILKDAAKIQFGRLNLYSYDQFWGDMQDKWWKMYGESD